MPLIILVFTDYTRFTEKCRNYASTFTLKLVKHLSNTAKKDAEDERIFIVRE